MSENESNKGGLMGRITQLLGLKPNQVGMVKLVAIGLALGILFLNAGRLFGVIDSGQPPLGSLPVIAEPLPSTDELTLMEQEIAASLERSLSLVEGAGRVRVVVKLSSGPTVAPLTNVRQETTRANESAPDGSKRTTDTISREESQVMTKDGSRDVPAIAARKGAQIAGVLIVADGAKSATVRARLYEAAQTALDVPAHRVTVEPAERR